MRVMLSKNTDPSRGLVNGAIGTITNMIPIKCRTTNNSHVTPQTVKAKFDAVKINSSNSESVGLNPFTKQFFWPKGVSLWKKRNCYWNPVARVHKVQGLTLSKAVIDANETVFQDGMSFAALSRI